MREMGGQDKETDADTFLSTAYDIPQPHEDQLERLRQFVTQFADQLRAMEDAIDVTVSEVWDGFADPCGVVGSQYETLDLSSLVHTDNKVFSKITLVFASLCTEIREQTALAKTKFYPALIMFGEESARASGEPLQEGEAELMISRLMPLLQDMSLFLGRLYTLVFNIVHQLNSLYHQRQKLFHTTFNHVKLTTLFEYLGDLFTILITLDEIIQRNEALAGGWHLYKRMTKIVQSDPSRFGLEKKKYNDLLKLLMALEYRILNGNIFKNCVDQDFTVPALQVDPRLNREFLVEFYRNLKVMFHDLETHIGELSETAQRSRLVGFLGLYVFYRRLAVTVKSEDRKFFKNIWDLQRKIVVVHLFGRACWFPAEFLVNMLPQNARSTHIADLERDRRDFLRKLDDHLEADVQRYYLEVCTWMVRVESNFDTQGTGPRDVRDVLMGRTNLFVNGLLLACQVGNLLKTVSLMHVTLTVPIRASLVRPICQCVELLKAIEYTYHRKAVLMGSSLPHMTRQIAFNLQRIFSTIKARLESAKRLDETRLDMLAAMQLILQVLRGTSVWERRLVIKLAGHVALIHGSARDVEEDEIHHLLWKLDIISDLQNRVQEACDCSFFFWSRELIPPYFAGVLQRPQQCNKLKYFFGAMRDAISVLKGAIHELDNSKFVEEYRDLVLDHLNAEILDPLCQEVETDLRLHIHANKVVDPMNPVKTGVKDLQAFLNLRPLQWFDNVIDIKARVTHYLDQTFYNLTTVSLHDWMTYGEMRNLAKEKYGLEMTEVHLPTGTLEQGPDVLEIMRNIHVFVARYMYNLNMQMFVERQADSKYLNTINLRHIANSIRTHGTGIMNTTINYIYSFLVQKFVIFSEFLYDDHIKSRLMKDIRYFTENKEYLENKYPFERAEKFNKDIRKLGIAKDGSTFVDRFRQLVTEIGNALGYVRMIRSGGMHHCSNAAQFVPDLTNLKPFQDIVASDGLSAEARNAARNLDSVIENITRNFAEGVEYMKILVSVFADEARSQHFVDHMVKGKDRLGKKGKDAWFSDDGFAIGTAYLLKVLALDEKFDSLHWFESVNDKYQREKKKVEEGMIGRKKGDDELQTLQLTHKRITDLQTEFELFYYAFSGARIFFE